MRTTLVARPSLPLVISTAGSSFTISADSAANVAAAFSSAVAGFCTRYFAIFLSILMAAIVFTSSELPVVAFFESVVEIRGGVFLTVVLDLLVALHRNLAAVLEREH